MTFRWQNRVRTYSQGRSFGASLVAGEVRAKVKPGPVCCQTSVFELVTVGPLYSQQNRHLARAIRLLIETSKQASRIRPPSMYFSLLTIKGVKVDQL